MPQKNRIFAIFKSQSIRQAPTKIPEEPQMFRANRRADADYRLWQMRWVRHKQLQRVSVVLISAIERSDHPRTSCRDALTEFLVLVSSKSNAKVEESMFG